MTTKTRKCPAEGGFVEGLFELWKVKSKIVRARSEIIATGNPQTTPTDLVISSTKNNALLTQAICPDSFRMKAKS